MVPKRKVYVQASETSHRGWNYSVIQLYLSVMGRKWNNKVVEQSSRTEMTFQRSENANRNLTKASYRVEERRSAFSVVITLSTHISCSYFLYACV